MHWQLKTNPERYGNASMSCCKFSIYRVAVNDEHTLALSHEMLYEILVSVTRINI